ncbi:MAG: dimethylamine monooxygenase subunit DmmA family protein [Thermomicrobiales bacterium]
MSPRTSVPVWSATAPVLPPGAMAWTLFSLAPPTGDTLQRWLHDLRSMPGAPVDVIEVTPDALAAWLDALPEWFAQEVDRRVVGWQIAATGAEHAVLALAAIARKAGLLPSELVLHAETRSRKRLYCPMCSTITDVADDNAQPLRCAGCGHALAMQPHLSRQRGAYLGTLHLASPAEADDA